MNETIDLGIKFVRGWEPSPIPTPGSDVTNVTSGIAQTGDFNVALIVGLMLMALTIAGVIAYAFIKNKQLASGSHSISSVSQQMNFSNFSTRAKVAGAIMMILAVACTIIGCFSTNAHAANGDCPLVPDSSEITATVAKDGTFTLDTCKLTNEGTEKYTIEESSVKIAKDATDIEGLDQTKLTINGFGDGKVLFSGKPYDPSEFRPTDLEDLASGASTTLTFIIDLPEDIDIESLFDKQVFTISLTPVLVSSWQAMQATSGDTEHQIINFYPAFNVETEIAGYNFSADGGISTFNPRSMGDIYDQVKNTVDKTLYYRKISSSAQPLKCYTVIDYTWNNVFDPDTMSGKATKYNPIFLDYYVDNGISTAELNDSFGQYWETSSGGEPDYAPTVNNVLYSSFYESYGGAYDAGLLSYHSNCPWGSCACMSWRAYYFNVSLGGWSDMQRITNVSGVVLAKVFN